MATPESSFRPSSPSASTSGLDAQSTPEQSLPIDVLTTPRHIPTRSQSPTCSQEAIDERHTTVLTPQGAAYIVQYFKIADIPTFRRISQAFNRALLYQNVWKQIFVNSGVREHPYRSLAVSWILDTQEGRFDLTCNYCLCLKLPYREGDPEFEKIKNDTCLLVDFYLSTKHIRLLTSNIYQKTIYSQNDKVTQWEAKDYAFAMELLKKTRDSGRILLQESKLRIRDLASDILLNIPQSEHFKCTNIDEITLLLNILQRSERLKIASIDLVQCRMAILDKMHNDPNRAQTRLKAPQCTNFFKIIAREDSSLQEVQTAQADVFALLKEAYFHGTGWNFDDYDTALMVCSCMPPIEQKPLIKFLDQCASSLSVPSPGVLTLKQTCQRYRDYCVYEKPRLKKTRKEIIKTICTIVKKSKKIDIEEHILIIETLLSGTPFTEGELEVIRTLDNDFYHYDRSGWPLKALSELYHLLINAKRKGLVFDQALTSIPRTIYLACEEFQLSTLPDYFDFLMEITSSIPDSEHCYYSPKDAEEKLERVFCQTMAKTTKWTSEQVIDYLALIDKLPEPPYQSNCLEALGEYLNQSMPDSETWTLEAAKHNCALIDRLPEPHKSDCLKVLTSQLELFILNSKKWTTQGIIDYLAFIDKLPESEDKASCRFWLANAFTVVISDKETWTPGEIIDYLTLVNENLRKHNIHKDCLQPLMEKIQDLISNTQEWTSEQVTDHLALIERLFESDLINECRKVLEMVFCQKMANTKKWDSAQVIDYLAVIGRLPEPPYKSNCLIALTQCLLKDMPNYKTWTLEVAKYHLALMDVLPDPHKSDYLKKFNYELLTFLMFTGRELKVEEVIGHLDFIDELPESVDKDKYRTQLARRLERALSKEQKCTFAEAERYLILIDGFPDSNPKKDCLEELTECLRNAISEKPEWTLEEAEDLLTLIAKFPDSYNKEECQCKLLKGLSITFSEKPTWTPREITDHLTLIDKFPKSWDKGLCLDELQECLRITISKKQRWTSEEIIEHIVLIGKFTNSFERIRCLLEIADQIKCTDKSEWQDTDYNTVLLKLKEFEHGEQLIMKATIENLTKQHEELLTKRGSD
ncbi:hypothetical protein ElyMa_000646200 [Elysia marginata]|uniref:Uncharacterized protein n=1 Tax=Elysia marginata TaxID=1093978 RepID=A0AAV4GDA6_9GAST|nr:hypothetical protein ElyMa_000646200 [Elysia marginata]